MGKKIDFTIMLSDNGTFKKVTMDAEELGKAVRSVQEESEKAKRTIITWSEVSQAVGVLQDAVGELQSIVSDLTSAYQVQLVAETQLNTIMRQRMNATDQEIQSVKDLCSAQQELGVIGDEVQLSGAQQMATFLQNKQSLDVLIPAMNNLIAQQNGLNATNQDAVSIGNMMGKAMQGQVEVLQRVGITFTDAQKQVLQFGTESERAAMLAQVITDNVGNMNAELAKTDAGKWKQVDNTLGDIKEKLGGMVQRLAPAITILSQITVAASGVGKLATSIYTVFEASKTMVVSLNIVKNAHVSVIAISRVLTASYTGQAVGATTAAIATRALSMAIKGLLISTGVGIAMVALTEVIYQLSSSSSDAANDVDSLSQAEQEAKQAHQQTAQQIASITSEMDLNIAKLKDFKGNKEQEKKLVQEMNTKYGEAMGYYSTVSQWYAALTANSKTYCDQMINEINIRDLANKAASLKQQQHNLIYDERGNKRKYGTRNKTKTVTHVSGTDPNNPDITTETIEIKGSSQLDGVNKKLKDLHQQEQNTRKEMQKLVEEGNKIDFKKVKGWQATMPGSGGGKTSPTKTSPKPTKTDKKDDPLAGSIDWYNKAINDKKKELEATASDTVRSYLQREVEGLERTLGMIKIKCGIEKVPPIEVKKETKGILDTIDEQMADFMKKYDGRPIVLDIETTAKEQDINRIKELANIDLGNFESVRSAFANIQGIVDPTAKGFAAAGASCQALGSAMQQLGSDSAAGKAGMIMAAIGQIVLSFAQALRSCTNWVEWLAFGISGTAQMVSIIATVSKFATGGIVGGNQKSGDNVLVRVNSGEMILNAAQQARLFAIADGTAAYGASSQIAASFAQGVALPSVSVQTDRLQGIMADEGGKQPRAVEWRLRGRDIVAAVANETRSNRRRSNIRLK